MPVIEPATLSRLQFGDHLVAAGEALPLVSKRRASDGSTLWWGGADTPGPPHIVAPGNGSARPGGRLADAAGSQRGRGISRQRRSRPRSHWRCSSHASTTPQARMFRAVLPGQSDGLVEFLPVLRFAGQPISTRLSEIDRMSSISGGLCGAAGRDLELSA